MKKNLSYLNAPYSIEIILKDIFHSNRDVLKKTE